MRAQGFWMVVVAEETYDSERLYANETLAVDSAAPAGAQAQPGDRVALVVAGEPPLLFGLAVVTAGPPGQVTVRYTHRMFDEPRKIEIAATTGLSAVDESEFGRLTASVPTLVRPASDRAEWLVSVALPIEAASRAEAVREFWSYVDKLGPRELPAFVWPRGDELAMQAFVLGEEANLDPEED